MSEATGRAPTVAVSRRRALGAIGAGLAGAALGGGGAAARAASAPLGFHNAPAGGIGPAPMRLLNGAAPAGLEGALYRNGPGHFVRGGKTLGHWFDGDGLVRAFRIANGEASVAARFVDTPKRKRDESADAFVTGGFGTTGRPGAGLANPDDANAANTSLLAVGDRLWALWEAGGPYGLHPETLSTEGLEILRDDLAHMPFSAHPKVEPDGRIWNFGLDFGAARVIVWRLASNGAVEAAEVVDLPQAAYIHDWAMTRTKLILPLAPWIVGSRRPPFVANLDWRPEEGMKILVIDKDDLSKRRTYDAPAGFLFHTADAFEEADGTIRFDACLADAPTLDAEYGAKVMSGRPLARPEPVAAMFALRPDGRGAIEKTPFAGEFPRIDPRLAGSRRARLYAAAEGAKPPQGSYRFSAVMAVNWDKGEREIFDFGPDILVEEHIFVPKPDDAAGGWLVGAGLNLKAEASELYVFDAERIADGPVAAWRAPAPLPLGFHGVWRTG